VEAGPFGPGQNPASSEPSFDEAPWPSLSSDAIDFVKRLLNKDYRKRLTAAQALSKFLKLFNLLSGFIYPSWYYIGQLVSRCHAACLM